MIEDQSVSILNATDTISNTSDIDADWDWGCMFKMEVFMNTPVWGIPEITSLLITE